MEQTPVSVAWNRDYHLPPEAGPPLPRPQPSSGVLYKMVHTGPGTLNLTKKDRCVLHYRGALPDGTEVESTYAAGTPANVTVAAPPACPKPAV